MNDTPFKITPENAAEVLRVIDGFKREFHPSEVKVKPAIVKGDRALALEYLDARSIQDRLDEVVQTNNWEDDYEFLPNGSVVCRLRVRIGGEWITKCDVGSPSEQPDEGDRVKASVSDALKRAAVKFGIGRYLYRRPQVWMDYDPVKKCIVRPATGNRPTQATGSAKTDGVSDSAREIAALFDAARTRAEGADPYKRYDAALKAGKVSEADKAHIDAALNRFTARCPKVAAGA